MKEIKDYKYYKQLVADKGYKQADINRGVGAFMSYRTAEKFFMGYAISKTNEQIIINYINHIETK